MTQPAALSLPWWRSLRLRIAAAVAGVTLAVLVPFGVFVDYQAGVDARERLRVAVLDRLEAAATVYLTFGQLRYEASTDASLLPQPLRGLAVGARSSYFDGQTMWATTRLSDDQFLTVSSASADLEAQRSQLRQSLAVAGAASLAAALGLGWLAGHRLSLRLRRGAAAAGRIAEGEQAQATQPGADEVSVLTGAVDSLAKALNARLDQERRFTADAAHELRTPVTALVSAAELLPGDEIGTLVKGQVARLRRLVTDLLEISRLDAGETVQPERADSATAIRQGLAATGLTDAVTLRVTAGVPVLVEQRRLERVLANLVLNAQRHGRPPIEVLVDGSRVQVRDHGDGFPASLLADGPRRFSSTGGGSGLGLTIALAQADALGAQLSFSNDGGARATLVLAAGDATSTG